MATESQESRNTDETAHESHSGLLHFRTVERILSLSLNTTAVVLIGFLWIPLAIMIFLSFAENTTTIFPFEGFTLSNYAVTVSDGAMWNAVQGSLLIATVAASIATVLGVLASLALTRYAFKFKELYRTFGIIPMVIPGIVLGLSLRIYFQEILGILPGFMTVVLAHSLYGIPFVLLIVTARLYSFDESLEEAARDLGAGPLETFKDYTSGNCTSRWSRVPVCLDSVI